MKTRITIQSPCNAEWATMSGDERRRLCALCNKHVHDLSAMEESEAEALVRRAKGKLCVRYQPDADGRVVHRGRSRWARWGLAALAGLTAAPAFAGGKVDTEQGVGAWIAEVVGSLAGQLEEATPPEPPMIMGEMALESEPHAFENRTDGPLVVDCGLEKTTIAPGASQLLEAWPDDTCSVLSGADVVQIEGDQVVCTRTSDGLSCAPAVVH